MLYKQLLHGLKQIWFIGKMSRASDEETPARVAPTKEDEKIPMENNRLENDNTPTSNDLGDEENNITQVLRKSTTGWIQNMLQKHCGKLVVFIVLLLLCGGIGAGIYHLVRDKNPMRTEMLQLKTELSADQENAKLQLEEIRRLKLQLERMSADERNNKFQLMVIRRQIVILETVIAPLKEDIRLRLLEIEDMKEELGMLKINATWKTTKRERNIIDKEELNRTLAHNILLLQEERETSARLRDQKMSTCQRSRCRPCWKEHNSHCYYFSHTEMKWQDARQRCRDYGGDLALVSDAEDQEFLSNLTLDFVQQHSNLKLLAAWIGLTDMVREGSFQWTDGSKLHENMTFWKTPPNNVVTAWEQMQAGQDCVGINAPNLTGPNWLNNWDDIGCRAERNYICETEVLII